MVHIPIAKPTNDIAATPDDTKVSTTPNDALAAITEYVNLVWQPGDVRELRILRSGRKAVLSGYFDSPDLLAKTASTYDGMPEKTNIYMTINPVNPSLIARAQNHVAELDTATSDKDIARRSCFAIDIDPVRSTGISATNDEASAAIATAGEIRDYLRSMQFADPIAAMTGNGMNLLYPTDLPNDDKSTALIRQALVALGERFGSDRVNIDQTVYNASRILTVIGTIKQKGDNTTERPHRRSAITGKPKAPGYVTSAQLATVGGTASVKSPGVAAISGSAGPAILQGWLDTKDITYRAENSADGTTWYNLQTCPFHPDDGTPYSCGVGVAATGKFTGHCFHDRGADAGWQEFRSVMGLVPQTPPTSPTPTRIVQGTTGSKSILLIEPQPPVAPLVGPFMANNQNTILFGPGGVGKGTIAAWMIVEHVRSDPDAFVYILDFENHDDEWTWRLRALGATPLELARIHWASPYSDDWTYPRGLLSDIAPYVKEDCDKYNATLLVVDSMSVAAGAGEKMGGANEANAYADALRTIKRRTLTLAHVTGAADKWPKYPFGSVHHHNQSRETWAVERIDMDSGPNEKDYGLTYMRVELRNRKAQRREAPPNQRITFTFEPNDGAITAQLEEVKPNFGALIHDVLREAGEPLTIKQILSVLREGDGETMDAKQVYQAIRRRQGSRHGDIETHKGYPAKYSA